MAEPEMYPLLPIQQDSQEDNVTTISKEATNSGDFNYKHEIQNGRFLVLTKPAVYNVGNLQHTNKKFFAEGASIRVVLFSSFNVVSRFASNEIYISSNGSSEASCGSIHSPCLSLSDITQWENDTVVIIEGSIVLDRVIEIHSIHNLTFTSSSASSSKNEKAAVINCICPLYNCGLIIEDCQDVTFNELNVSGCSMQHVIGVSKRHFYRSGIIINTTTNILLSNVSISNNYGTGLLLFNAAGNITIKGSIFSSNLIPYALQRTGSNDTIVHGGAGLVILISACDIGAADDCMINMSVSEIGRLVMEVDLNLDFGGAGMAMGIAHHNPSYVSSDNNVTVVRTTFFNNVGNYASGVLIYCNALSPGESIKYNYVHFIKSTWDSNNGTAIEIEPNTRSQYFTEFTTKAIFEDCNFTNNTILNQCNHTMASSYSFSEGIGAFAITKLTVYFKGTYGGAIGLVGYSSIQYNNDTKFEFTNNSASIVGGAIY
uniref:Right handed beta helix domain-containing protein n=1 Tax=Amphimedon queenslandica TaxID=400682 RepID=A0A1X7TSQ4_AMPQE